MAAVACERPKDQQILREGEGGGEARDEGGWSGAHAGGPGGVVVGVVVMVVLVVVIVLVLCVVLALMSERTLAGSGRKAGVVSGHRSAKAGCSVWLLGGQVGGQPGQPDRPRQQTTSVFAVPCVVGRRAQPLSAETVVRGATFRPLDASAHPIHGSWMQVERGTREKLAAHPARHGQHLPAQPWSASPLDGHAHVNSDRAPYQSSPASHPGARQTQPSPPTFDPPQGTHSTLLPAVGSCSSNRPSRASGPVPTQHTAHSTQHPAPSTAQHSTHNNL